MPSELTSIITTLEFFESFLEQKCKEKEKKYKDCIKNKKSSHINDCIPYFKEFNNCHRKLNEIKN